MRLKHDKTLITGTPGVGKTTLVQTLIGRMPPEQLAGFITAEIRSKGSRLGFELQGLNGARRILAHVNIKSPHRVGKYGVDTDGFEDFLEAMAFLDPHIKLIVIDEIGKMELFSNRFRRLIRNVLNSDKQLLASLALKGTGLIRELKQRPDIHLVEVTHFNREYLPGVILEGW
jgi:nucleoside-triphosphatase